MNGLLKINIVRVVFLFFISSTFLFSQPTFSKYNSMSGSFSRLGFGARGMGMGNAMTAVDQGNMVSYYNPSLSVFQDGNYFHTSYSILSLDRSLNFLNFTKRFELGKKKNSDSKSIAGISLGVINSGVSGIEERDNQGIKYSDLSTSENQFFVALANRFSEKFALGVGLKFYYYKLYEKISSTAFGFDIGAFYKYSDNLKFGATITDINSKYKWDTSSLYDIEGNSTIYKFPLLMKLGASYFIESIKLLTSVEIEHSNAETDFLRLGVEYNIYGALFLRGGIDKVSISNSDIPMRPSLGFSYFKDMMGINLGIDYAFVIEPYSPFDQHIIGLEIIF